MKGKGMKENKKIYLFFNKNFIPIFLASFLFLFLSRNVLTNNNWILYSLSFLSALCLLTPIFMLSFVNKIKRYFPENLRSFLWVILSMGGASFCLYIFQSDLVWLKLFSSGKSQLAIEGWRKFLTTAYLVLFLATFVLAIMFQSSLRASLSEGRKMAQVKITGINIVILFSILLSLNYIAKLRTFSIDMTALGKYGLSPEGEKIIKGIDKKVTITGFYPFFHELYRELELILNHIRTVNPLIEFSIIDALKEKNIADAKKIDDYGYILVESIDLDELNVAQREKQKRVMITKKSDLKNAEKKIIEAILAVSGKKKNLYFTSGHGEISGQGPFKDELNTLFRDQLERQNYKVKDLTVQGGFPPRVPPDADALMIIGSKSSFVYSEQKAIQEYLSKGGRVFLALDPKRRANFSFLLNSFGLVYRPKEILSETSAEGRPEYLVTDHYSSDHPITTPFQNLRAQQKFSILQGTGYFEEKAMPRSTLGVKAVPKSKEDKDYKISFFLKSKADSWVDQIPNRMNDKSEPKKVRNLAVSISQETPGSSDEVVKEHLNESKSNVGFRLVLFGDSDFFKNEFIVWPGNQYEIGVNAIKWLLEDERIMGLLPKEIEGERVNLTDVQDDLVFYSLVFIWPSLILAGGFFYLRRQRPST